MIRRPHREGLGVDESADEIRRTLQEVRLFADVLSSEELDRLAQQCVPMAFAAGSSLMGEGDPALSLFCIAAGTVALTYHDRFGRVQQIRELGPGNVVGEIELLTGGPRIASVVAVTDVAALEISRPALQEAFAASPELEESFRAILSHRRRMLDQIAAERADSLPARLARTIGGLIARRGRL